MIYGHTDDIELLVFPQIYSSFFTVKIILAGYDHQIDTIFFLIFTI